MQGQEFLIEVIQDLIPDTETPDSIKHLSRTTLIEAAGFPAVFAEEEPYDFNQDIGQNDVITRKENCNLIIVVESVNVNEMTEATFLAAKEKLKELTDTIIAKILEKVPTFSKIANLRLGRGEIYDGTINATPVMWNLIPVEIILVN